MGWWLRLLPLLMHPLPLHPLQGLRKLAVLRLHLLVQQLISLAGLFCSGKKKCSVEFMAISTRRYGDGTTGTGTGQRDASSSTSGPIGNTATTRYLEWGSRARAISDASANGGWTRRITSP